MALGKQKTDPAALLCRSRKLNGNKRKLLKQKLMEENHVSWRFLLLLGVVSLLAGCRAELTAGWSPRSPP